MACGVNYEFEYIAALKKFIAAKIGYGAKSYLEEVAMTERKALYAIEKGKEFVQNIATDGYNTSGFGEIFFGNTSSAALIMSSIMQINIKECIGREQE